MESVFVSESTGRGGWEGKGDSGGLHGRVVGYRATGVRPLVRRRCGCAVGNSVNAHHGQPLTVQVRRLAPLGVWEAAAGVLMLLLSARQAG